MKRYKSFISKDNNKYIIDLYVQYSCGEYEAFVMPYEYVNKLKLLSDSGLLLDFYSPRSGQSMVIEEVKKFNQKRLEYLASGQDEDANKCFSRLLERVCKKNNIKINDCIETELT